MPSYNLDLIPQTYPMGCWIAATNMLRSYKSGATITDDPYYEDGWLGPNGGLNTDRTTLSAYCGANGLTLYNGPSFNQLQVLINRGPFMAVGVFPGVGTHFYVIGAMDAGQSLENTSFDLYDPMPVNVGRYSSGLSLSDFRSSDPNGCKAAFQ
jgi:hypothetical protein